MVQFGAYLADSQIPAFTDGYVRYRDLKRVIKRFKKKPTSDDAPPVGTSASVEAALHMAEAAADVEAPASTVTNIASSPTGTGIRRRRSRIARIRQSSLDSAGSAAVPQDVRLLRVNATEDRSVPMNFGPTMMQPEAGEVNRLLDDLGDDVNLRRLLPEAHLLDYPELETEFCMAFQRELKRARAFFLSQQSNFEAKLTAILRHIDATPTLRDVEHMRFRWWTWPGNWRARKERTALHTSCAELWKAFDLLMFFHHQNLLALSKILKKHDKVSSWKGARSLFLPLLFHDKVFVVPDKVEAMRRELEGEHARVLTGNRAKSVSALNPSRPRSSFFSTLMAGLLVGCGTSALFAAVVIASAFPALLAEPVWLANAPVLRGVTLLAVFLVGWGVDLAVLRSVNVNLELILETGPLTPSDRFVMVGAGLLMVVALVMVMLMVHSLNPVGVAEGWVEALLSTPAWLGTVLVLVLPLVLLLCPLPVSMLPNRWFFISQMGAVASAPFSTVTFPAFFLADQLTSAVRILLDLEYGLCYLVTGSFLTNTYETCAGAAPMLRYLIMVWPYWARFAQCLHRYYISRGSYHHLYNAGKYTTAMVVTTLSWAHGNFVTHELRVAWIVSGIIGVIYAYYWDIVRDWGLLEGVDVWGAIKRRDLSSVFKNDEGASRRTLLRRKRLYPAPLYAWAAASNLVLRCLWIVSISSSSISDSVPEAYAARFALGLGEVYRRVQWNLFRVENEHLNNCGQFRVVNQRRFMQLRTEEDDKADEEEDEEGVEGEDSASGEQGGFESGFGISGDDSGSDVFATSKKEKLSLAMEVSERARSRYLHVERVRDSSSSNYGGVELIDMGTDDDDDDDGGANANSNSRPGLSVIVPT